jgi:hypothetical protein
MGRFLKHILVFLIPIVVIIGLLPVNQRLKYQGLKDDCFNHGIWIYDRIYNNPEPIDIVFLGSSQTINGIDDKLISDGTAGGVVVNLGYCRLGRNFSYALLKDVLSVREIKYVVVEVRENEDRYSHPIFPYIAQSSDVFFPNPFFNRDMLSDMWTHVAYKIELSQNLIYQQEDPVPVSMHDYGFAPSPDTAAISFLEEVLQKRSKPKSPLSNFEQGFHGNFSRVYLKKISRLCIDNDIKLVFLYMPTYGANLDKPKEYDTYIKYGEVLIPPKHIYENQLNWQDENHLNSAGANELSLWLANHMNNNW